MSRSMSYIVTINSIEPIEGKDRIVYIGFKENGYHVIGDTSFSIGDLVVYFEVDSILPVKKEFQFLRNRCYHENLKGFLIKNMKMCGKYSNGLIMTTEECHLTKEYKPEYDLTDILEIRKYEPEEDAPTKDNKLKTFLLRHTLTRWLGNILFETVPTEFPAQLIDKSDETNIQNHTKIFDTNKNIPCYVSTKMEGQSVTMLFLPRKKHLGKFAVYSHRYIGTKELWHMAKKIDAKNKLKKAYLFTGHIFAVQGERCAKKVKKGIYQNGEHFYVYLIKDLTTGKVLNFDSFINFCKKYGFEHVPILYSGVKLQQLFLSVDIMQNFVEHQWFKVGSNPIENYTDTIYSDIKEPLYHRHEGIVIRGLNNEFSFKVKSNEYALKF
jgi:hypothetical protein